MTGLEAWPGGQRQAITMPRAIFPVADVAAGAALLGNVSQDPDADGIYRRLGLFAIFDGRVVPSLALAAYTQAKPGIKAVLRDGKLHLGATVVPLDARGRAIPRWRAPAAFPAVSAAAVIQSELALREGGRPLLDPAMPDSLNFQPFYTLPRLRTRLRRLVFRAVSAKIPPAVVSGSNRNPPSRYAAFQHR